MNKSLHNPYTFTIDQDNLTLTQYYDSLLSLNWSYHLIDDNNRMYQEEAKIHCHYVYAKEQKNPRYLFHFNMVRKEFRNNNII